jgi:hypothetical protein
VSSIRIEPEGRHWRITGRQFGAPAGTGNDDEVTHADAFAASYGGGSRCGTNLHPFDTDLDDDVPF